MNSMLLAAATVLTLGVGAAYAGGGDGKSVTTLFTSIPCEQTTLVLPAAPRIAVANQAGVAVADSYATTAQRTGTWLFQPDEFGGGDN